MRTNSRSTKETLQIRLIYLLAISLFLAGYFCFRYVFYYVAEMINLDLDSGYGLTRGISFFVSGMILGHFVFKLTRRLKAKVKRANTHAS